MLDLRTLALINMLSYAVLFVATLTVWRLVPQERSLRDWTTASVLAMLSALLLGLRGIIPDFLSIVVANSMLVLGLGFMHLGTRGLLGVAPGRAWHWVAAGAMFIAAIVFTYLAPNLPARIAAVSMLLVPFLVDCGWMFWRHGDAQLKAIDRITALIFTGGAVLFLLRLATASGAAVSADYTSTPSWIVAAPYIYSILFNVWLAIMLALKVSARLQQRLGEALGRAETANRELNETLGFNQTILVNSPLPIGVYAARGQCVLANDAYARFVGATREALLAQNFHDIVAWRESGLLEDCRTALARNCPRQREAHVVSSFGKELWFECRMLPIHINGENHLLIQFFDLTERRMLEQIVAQSEQRMEMALAGADLGMWDVDLRSGRFSHNARLVVMVGYAPGEVELTDKLFQSLLHPDDAPGFGAAFYAHLKGHTSSFEAEYRVRHKDDHWVWIHSRGKVVERDANGRALRITGTNLDVSERKASDAALKAREERLSTLIASMQDLVFVFDTGGAVVEYFQPPQARCASWKLREQVLGKTYIELFPAELAGRFGRAIAEIMMEGQPQTFEYSLAVDGSERAFHATLSQLVGGGKYPTGFLAVVRDITDRKLAEQELRVAATAFETREGLMVTDSQGVILRVNRAFSEMTGYSAAEAVGKTPAMLRSGHHDEAFYRQLWTILKTRKFWDGEIWDRRKNGEVFPEWLTISAVSGPDGGVTNYVGIFSDITDRKLAEEQIHNLAFYDPLTQLPNRRLLLDRLGQALSASARRENHGAILFLDLDNFKTLNDTLGHETGDLLLIEVAKRMISCVRAEDTVARLGGDEFVVALEDLGRDAQVAAAQAMDVAEKIRKALNLPYEFRGRIHRSSPSIGVCLFQGGEVPIGELLMRADKAMYRSKAGGRNRACLCDISQPMAENS